MDIKKRRKNNRVVVGNVEAYCVKCKQKQIMANPKSIVMKNGRPAKRGKCPACGSGMFRIGG